MFLTKDNKIKWNLMGYVAVIVVLAVLLGVFAFDKPLYLFLRQFDCVLFRVFDVLFATKMWLIVSAAVLLLFYIKKALK